MAEQEAPGSIVLETTEQSHAWKIDHHPRRRSLDAARCSSNAAAAQWRSFDGRSEGMRAARPTPRRIPTAGDVRTRQQRERQAVTQRRRDLSTRRRSRDQGSDTGRREDAGHSATRQPRRRSQRAPEVTSQIKASARTTRPHDMPELDRPERGRSVKPQPPELGQFRLQVDR
jgi:hypothetical protein